MAESDGADGAAPETVTIKKYANRRLYNTATSSYVTLENLCDMVRETVRISSFATRGPATISPAKCSPRSSSSRSPRATTCCP